MTKADKQMRRTGITAAEAVGLVGLTSLIPELVYRRKVYPKGFFRMSPTAAERQTERAVLAAYQKRVGLRPTRHPLVRNPVQRFAILEPYFTVGSPLDDTRLVIPFSLSCSPWLELPPAYVARAQWGLGVTGHSRADVAILFRKTLKVFCLYFDGHQFADIYEVAEIFMSNYVLQKISPMEKKA